MEKVVAVVWEDVSLDQADMFTREELIGRGGTVFTTIGYFVNEDDKYYRVAAEQCANGAFRGITTIHKALITSVVPIGTWPKKEKKRRGRQVERRDLGTVEGTGTAVTPA